MDREIEAEDIGAQLGAEGVGGAVSNAEAYCEFEAQRISLANQPRIMALQQEGWRLSEDERDLVDRLKLAPPPGDLRSRRRKAIYYWAVALVLMFSALAFSIYSLRPFDFGIEGYIICLGIAIIVPMMMDMALKYWNSKSLVKYLATIACLVALTAAILLAVVRGNILAETIKTASSVIVIDDAQTQNSQPENSFYDKSTSLLIILTCLLTIAMDAGAGLVIHEAGRMGTDSPEDWDQLRERLAEIRSQMAGLIFEIKRLEVEPQEFKARLCASFYRSLLTHAGRSAKTKLPIIAVAALTFAMQGRGFAQTRASLVIAVDLTKSVDVRGPDGKTEFQKNIDAITKQLAQAQADSRITVIGITDHSFTQPDILLSATIPANPGYFGERLNAARGELVGAWKARSTTLEPRFRETDIIGSLLLAVQILEQQSDAKGKVLFVYSDMRHHTRELDLETPAVVASTAQTVTGCAILSGLRGIEIHVLGADGSGRSIAEWQKLRAFWSECFGSAGATMRTYTVMR
jgi:hypothetical protein